MNRFALSSILLATHRHTSTSRLLPFTCSRIFYQDFTFQLDRVRSLTNMAHLGKGHSEACCSIPPVSMDYSAKGNYVDVNGTKTYRTGPTDAESGIFIVYDIFGFSNQALQVNHIPIVGLSTRLLVLTYQGS